MVEWKKLGEVCGLERGVRVIKKDLQQEGLIPVFQNSLVPLGFFNKSNYPPNTPFVICAGAAGEVGFCSKPFWAADDCTCILCSPSIDNKYIYYCLLVNQHTLKSQVRKASVPRLSKDVISKLIIPVPSLSEQQRIVGILDTFTSSIENLKEQIAQRRKQYEYYRDQLLDLEGKEGVEMKTLGEVCEIKGDYGLSVPSKPFDGVRYLRITGITDMGWLNDDAVSADLKEECNKEPLVDGDILFARTGATVGKTLVYRNEFGKCFFAGYLIRYRLNKSIVSPQFMFHFTHSTKYYNWVQSSLATGAQPNISAQRYNVLTFPVPSISEQQRIVSILDTFEASIQNLEAQLKQREKQYEYYRNKLLTFE